VFGYLLLPRLACNNKYSAWASIHRGKWGQLTPPGKMDEKLRSENMQKTAVLYVYVIF